MKDIRLAITGPHSAGKTTVLNMIRDHKVIKDNNIEILPEVTRIIKEHGFDINEAGENDTQLLVMAAHINNILLHPRALVDRSLLDGYIYTDYLYATSNVDSWIRHYAEDLYLEYIDRYDRLFYIPCEFKPVADGVRSVNKKFHKGIVSRFEREIKSINFQFPDLVVEVRGTPEERANIIINEIEELVNE